MDFKEYQALARRTQNPKITLHDRKMHALHGLCSEVGEIHGIFQKYYQGHDVDYNELAAEMGDLMWFMAELCDTIGISLEAVCEANIEKLRHRYPEGFEAEASRSRYKGSMLDRLDSLIERLEDDKK